MSRTRCVDTRPRNLQSFAARRHQTLLMLVVQIPYPDKATGSWIASLGDADERTFPSRVDALMFAMRTALNAEAKGDECVINVQGSDGRWRAFDPDLNSLL